MKTNHLQPRSHNRNLSLTTLSLIICCAFVAKSSLAATVWTGPSLTFTKASFADPTQPANQDRLTPHVWLTRASSRGLYNANQEAGYNGVTSPVDTEWAYGDINNYNTLTYSPWLGWCSHSPPSVVGQSAVLHLMSDDIYVAITFNSWDAGHVVPGGGFSYTRSTP